MNKVGIHVHSGLGNQLFMIFTMLSYYYDNCTDYILYQKTMDFKTERYYWDYMFKELSNKVEDTCNIKDKYEEKEYHYNNIPIMDNDIVLKGFFQSYKYFDNNINKIKTLLNFDKKISDVKEEYPEYFNRKTIALHFRIGNYYNLQNLHPIQKIEYYLNAFKELKKHINIQEYNILIFCQECDNNIVNEYVKYININYKNLHYKKVADNIPDWKQMLLMASCDNYIIANSTFSWMGAYLSTNKNAIVISPKKWFGPYYKNNKLDDLRPESWKIVE